MNKRKLEKSQRDYIYKRRRSVRLWKKKLKEMEQDEEWVQPNSALINVLTLVYQCTFAAMIIQKYFRGYMVRKNN